MTTPKMYKNEAAHLYVDCLPKELGEAIISIADIIRPMVEEIHSKPPETKDYYGDYLNIMSNHCKHENIIEMCLLIAGANPQGVFAARDVIKKIDYEVQNLKK